MALSLSSPVKFLKGVGPKRAEALQRLGIRTAGDLLYHTPHRYLDATTVTPLARAAINQEVTCVGRVVSTGVLPTRRGLRVFRAVLKDSSGLLECAWPGRPFLERQIKKGQLLLVTGPVRYYHGKQIVPHEFIVLAEPDEGEGTGDPGLVLPVYPATEGLTHRQIRALVQQHLDELLALVSDPHPPAFRATHNLIELRRALELMHRPKQVAEAELGRRRLAFDELFDQQLVQARARHLAKRARAGITFQLKRELTTKLRENLPFELTGDQRQAIREISGDMTAPLRMHRLLMGDVGTGKTVVALFAMLLAAENDYQAAIMAPTELLAEQHGATLTRLLEPLAIRPELLLGRMTAAEKAAVRERIAGGGARLVVGTHALIQEGVELSDLAVAVVDEQHRFGVEQRKALTEGRSPHVLHMTATPIPRTLALTVYGDLAVSEITRPPADRKPIKTAWVAEDRSAAAYSRLRKHLDAGRQAYVVCPLIEESETTQAKAAEAEAERLQKAELRGYRVGLLHGRLRPAERRELMTRFKARDLDVLVATTVIEVGVDVPNATIMIVQEADRFGLAQLHQLRGRVGRGAEQSYCLLISRAREDLTEPAVERLEALVRTNDGFELAEVDLDIRGSGQLLGTRQSGLTDLHFAHLRKDRPLLERARAVADDLVDAEGPLSDEVERAFAGRDLSAA